MIIGEIISGDEGAAITTGAGATGNVEFSLGGLTH
jgi:hypothetical protein